MYLDNWMGEKSWSGGVFLFWDKIGKMRNVAISAGSNVVGNLKLQSLTLCSKRDRYAHGDWAWENILEERVAMAYHVGKGGDVEVLIHE